jgi:hypothetical protein
VRKPAHHTVMTSKLTLSQARAKRGNAATGPDASNTLTAVRTARTDAASADQPLTLAQARDKRTQGGE